MGKGKLIQALVAGLLAYVALPVLAADTPVDDKNGKITNVNVGPDGTTNVQQSGGEVVEEEHIVEEHRHP